MQTRASAKKELERQEQDDIATREAAADPTPRRSEAVTSERTASDPSPIEDTLELVQEAEVEKRACNPPCM